MNNEELQKELYFADAVLGAIEHVKNPILVYDEEKEVVKKALKEYKSKIEDKVICY